MAEKEAEGSSTSEEKESWGTPENAETLSLTGNQSVVAFYDEILINVRRNMWNELQHELLYNFTRVSRTVLLFCTSVNVWSMYGIGDEG